VSEIAKIEKNQHQQIKSRFRFEGKDIQMKIRGDMQKDLPNILFVKNNCK
jgi:hypothetical protein